MQNAARAAEKNATNSNTNIDAENGIRPNLCFFICVTIVTIVNFDGDVDVDANADVPSEQSINSAVQYQC